MIPARAWRWLRNVVVGVTGLVALVGVLHLPIFRGFLMRVGGCPVARASAEDVDRARLMALSRRPGDASSLAPAPDRHAFGFALDTATRADVDAWAAGRKIDCDEVPAGRICKLVPSAAFGDDASLPPADEVAFAFAPGGGLKNVESLYRLPVADAARTGASIEKTLAGALGAPTETNGAFTPEGLAAKISMARVAYRYADRVTELTATNLGDHAVVREHTLSTR